MKKKLKYVVPPVVSYLRHSYPLGIIMSCVTTEESFEDWLASNYIALCWPNTSRFALFDMMVSYNDNPFIKLRTVSRGEFNYLLKNLSFDSVIRKLIDMGIYVQLNNDDYYLSTSRTYHVKHHLHQILIIGYDDVERKYICWGFRDGIYQELAVPEEEVVPFDAELTYGTDSVMILYSQRNAGFEMNVDAIMAQVRDYLESKNVALQVAHMGCFEQYKQSSFGKDCYNNVYDELENQYKNDFFDHRFLCVLSEHKKMMLNRMQYLKGKGVDSISKDDLLLLNQAYQHSCVAINNVIKLNKCYERDKKQKSYFKIVESIKKVEENESKALSNIVNQFGKEKGNEKGNDN